MKHYGIFVPYVPTSDEGKELLAQGANMIASEGKCWYDVVQEVQKDKSLKYVLFMDHDNVVVHVDRTELIHTYAPTNIAVAVVEDIPDYLSTELCQWILQKDGSFIQNEAYFTAVLMGTKADELEVANAKISHLQDLIDIGSADSSTEAEMLKWKKYRVALNNLNEKSKTKDLPKRPK